MRLNFFGPLSRLIRATPPATPAAREPRRPQAAAALDAGSPKFIATTASGSGDATLRAAAAAKLPDGEVLRKLAGLGGGASPAVPASLEHAAQQRMAQLIDAGTVDFAVLRGTTANTAALLAVAGRSGDPTVLPRALALIDPQQLAALVTAGSSSRLRQLAAYRIEDPAALKQLLKELRGKDKGVYKIIKKKCDALRAEEQRLAQLDHDIESLCAALERHGQRVWDEHYPGSLGQLEARWRTLEAQVSPARRARAGAAIERCREVITDHSRRLARQASEESERAAQRAVEERASAAAEKDAEQRAAMAARTAAETVAAAAALREAEAKAQAEQQAAEALLLRQVGGLIGKAHGALRDGNTARAAGLRRALGEKLLAMPVTPAHVAREVLKLDSKLEDYKEWKEHAVAPKRAELIEEMEALIGSLEDPPALADRIKQLQEDWKTISQGIVSDTEADWQRFHRASVTAYQPCRDYFEAQATLRQVNLEKRTQVLERLRAFETTQGESPDWRAVATVLREAPREWRPHYPIDRAAARAIQQEFDAAIGRLQARLDAWHAGNAAEKSALIRRAQQLRGQEDSREAVDAVKRLQLQWKQVGTVPRDREQTLWQEFREQCDAVYARREQAHADHRAQLDVSEAQGTVLCEDAERVATLSGTPLREGVQKIPQWRAAFDALGELPIAAERTLRKRFERALDLCKSKLVQQQGLEKEQSFTNLLEAASGIRRYGWARTHNAAAADLESLKQAAETFIAGAHPWPPGGVRALQDAWTDAAAAVLDAAAKERELRMLCIRGEILTDKPTPPEDQPLRREYQVQRLVQHMGRHAGAADELDALALEWVRVGAAPPALYDSLLARFLRCRRSS